MSILVDRRKLSKGWEYFDIMHKDRQVARICENGKCKIYYLSFMPYNLYFEESDEFDECVNNLNNFYYWCSSRVLTLDRKYAKEIMAAIGANQAVTDKERAMIAASYHALCLTDVYWLRAKDEKISFADINLYENSLSSSFTDVSLRGKPITVQNAQLAAPESAAGDVSVQGVAPKAWVRENGEMCLLKDGDARDVEAELLASKIVDCFDIPHVDYAEDVFDGAPVSKCSIITSEERSIVPFEFIEIYCVNRGWDVFEFVLKKDKYSYYMMNIVDYLIGNTDRHWGNWGFYVDNANNKLLGLHPLMDYNKAFTAYDIIDGAVCQTTAERMSQRDAALTAVKKVGLNQIKEIDETWFADEKIKSMFFARLAELLEHS